MLWPIVTSILVGVIRAIKILNGHMNLECIKRYTQEKIITFVIYVVTRLYTYLYMKFTKTGIYSSSDCIVICVTRVFMHSLSYRNVQMYIQGRSLSNVVSVGKHVLTSTT